MKTKNLKRFLSLAMALCLSLAMMNVAFASNVADTSGGSATSSVTLSSTEDGSLGGDPAATAMSVTVPTVLPIAVGTDGSVTTATDAKITNNSYGAVKVSGVSIQAAQGWHLTDFETNMANEKVDSNQVGFALTIGGGEQLATDSTEASQALLAEAIEGCYMTGAGNTAGNSVAIAYYHHRCRAGVRPHCQGPGRRDHRDIPQQPPPHQPLGPGGLLRRRRRPHRHEVPAPHEHH